MMAGGNSAIALLVYEHERIVLVLDALAEYADRLARGDGPAAADLGRFAAWLHDYADALHHAKEEDVLFPQMAAAGFPREGGPLAVMLEHHDEGRRLVGILAEAAASGQPLVDAEARRVARAAHDFVSLLRGHIRVENEVLYPMAQARLPGAAWDTIGEAFERVQSARAAERAGLDEVAAALVARYAPARSGVSSTG